MSLNTIVGWQRHYKVGWRRHSGQGVGPSQGARRKGCADKAQIGNSGSREAIMDSNGSGRRRFLKHAAALAGVGVGAGAGAEWAARGQSAKPEVSAKDAHDPGEHLRRGTLPRRGVRMSVDHITFYTPLQDYGGIITPY